MILDEFKSMVKSCLQDDEKAPDVKSGAFLLSFSPRYEDVLIQKNLSWRFSAVIIPLARIDNTSERPAEVRGCFNRDAI